MKIKVINAAILALGLTSGLQGAVAYADNCNTPANQALLKLKNTDVLSRINELNLTQAQKDQFKVMKKNFDAENKKVGDAGKAMNVLLNQIATSSTIDEARLDSIVSDAKKNMVIRQTQAATFRHNLYNLLNDQQKTKYHELQQQERAFFRMGLQCPDVTKPSATHPDPIDQIKNLDLTVEQKTKIMPLISSWKNQAKEIMLPFDDSAMSVEQMETQIVQSTSPIDTAKLNAFCMAQAELGGELIKNRVMVYHNIYENLNDPQKAQFMKIISKQ
ncbi:MAG: Spy/CpxP family protein refolding chaperone [Legionellaceae bacterium]|nr:Spy/CpxP family protein refolding chaperone [Legionellaceae bacterium]